MSTFQKRLVEKYQADAKVPEPSKHSKAITRAICSAIKGDIPILHHNHSLFNQLTDVQTENAKEFYDNLKAAHTMVKDILDVVDAAKKRVQEMHAGAVLQKGKNYL